MENEYVIRAEGLDLTPTLYNLLNTDIANKKYQQSNFGYTPKHHDNIQSKFRQWFEKLLFKKGYLKIHKLNEQSEQLILEHYKQFVEYVGQPFKIRYKTMGETKWIPPHSDVEISERVTGIPGNGDRTSLFVIIQGNGEKTSWFSYPGKFQFGKWFNPFKLKRQVTKELEIGKCYLFNTEALHSVSNLNPNKQRWVLTICWNTVSHQQLCEHYNRFIKLK